VTVTWITNATQVACWNYHTVFLLSDWTARAVWRNNYGQLWDWTTTNSTTPVTVSWITNSVNVFCWIDYTVFLLSDWTVKAVWNNNYGQLWDWTTVDKLTPVTANFIGNPPQPVTDIQYLT